MLCQPTSTARTGTSATTPSGLRCPQLVTASHHHGACVRPIATGTTNKRSQEVLMAWLAICDASTATGARAPDNNAAGIALPD
jgi:hypothetical protein